MKEKIIAGTLEVIKKAVEVSYESASMFGMYQAEEPENLKAFLEEKIE